MFSLLSYLKLKYIKQVRVAGNTYRHIQKGTQNTYIPIHTMADPVAGYSPNETEREHHKKQQLSSNV